MKKPKPRMPEGGAITDADAMSAEDYGELMRSRLEGEYRRFAEAALAHGEPPRGGKVLEIGPGPGWAGLMLLGLRPDLTLEGLDASADMVRAAAVNADREGCGGRASYRLGTAERLEGVAEGSVDLVISRDSLHHWEDPHAAFSAIQRVLKPGSRLYLADERRDLSFIAWCFVYIFGFLSMGSFSRYWRSSIRAAYTPEELRCLIPERPGSCWKIEASFMDLRLRDCPRD